MARAGEMLLFLIVTCAAAFIIRQMINGGYFRTILNHAPGPCRVIKVNGAEDFEILPDGLVIFSSGLRYDLSLSVDPVFKEREGKMFTFDMKQPNVDPRELDLKSFNRTGFNPHGISMYRDQSSGALSVFVVNHGPDAQAIEIFHFERKTHSLVHRRSVVHKLIYSPNDVVAVGPESFYVTNDNFFHFDNALFRGIGGILFQDILRSDVIFFDGSTAVEAAHGIKGANGINVDRTGRYVFVSSGFGFGVNIYKRHEDNSLELSQVISLGSYIDNINVDKETGNLWMGGVPKLLDVVAYAENHTHLAPAQILTVDLGPHSESGNPFPDYKTREVYMNDGNELKLSTVAVRYNRKLLVGSAFDNLLFCQLQAY